VRPPGLFPSAGTRRLATQRGGCPTEQATDRPEQLAARQVPEMSSRSATVSARRHRPTNRIHLTYVPGTDRNRVGGVPSDSKLEPTFRVRRWPRYAMRGVNRHHSSLLTRCPARTSHHACCVSPLRLEPTVRPLRRVGGSLPGHARCRQSDTPIPVLASMAGRACVRACVRAC